MTSLINNNLREIYKLQEEISDLEELRDTAKKISDSLEYLICEMLIEKKEDRLKKL